MSSSYVTGAAQAEQGEKKNIVVFHSYHEGFPWSNLFHRGIKNRSMESNIPINLYIEYLDQARMPGYWKSDAYLKHIKEKYEAKIIHSVLADDKFSATFAGKLGREIFNDATLLYASSIEADLPENFLLKNIFWRQHVQKYEKTIDFAIRLKPKTKNIYIVTDETPGNNERLRKLRDVVKKYEGVFNVEFITQFYYDELLKKLSELPKNSIIIYALVFSDLSGARFIPRQVAKDISEVSSAPVFSYWDTLLGTGVIGGHMVSAEQSGYQLLDYTLNGKLPDQSKLNYEASSGSYLIDWNAFSRFDFVEKNITDETIIKNKTPSPLILYRYEITAAAVTITILALMVLYISYLYKSRLKTLKQLQKSNLDLDLVRQSLAKRVQKRTKDLHQEKQKAEAANKAKSVFLSNISHDVRTPMNGVLSMLKVLKKTKTNAEQNKYIKMIEESGNQMVAMLNQILDYSRLSEKSAPDNESISLQKIINQIVSIYEPLALEKGVAVITSITDSSPIVLGDKVLIKQLLNNFISNAIKYTESGNVTIKLDYTRKKGNHISVKISVKDTGIGIPKEMQEKIFDRFEKVENEYAQYQPGIGLGLNICQSISRTMNGAISLFSEPGKGSEFCFFVDLEISDALLEETKTDEVSLKIEPNITILLAEDESIARFATKYLLEDQGFHVLEAEDGLSAVMKVEENIDVDLILMDINMPKLNGLDATKKIRSSKNKNISKIPIIGLTASITEEQIKTYYEVGINSVTTKPLNLNELYAAMNSVLAD